MADTGGPVAQGGTGPVAVEAGAHVYGEGTGCAVAGADVFRGNPDGIAVRHGGTIIAPAGTRRAADEGRVAGKAIRRACAFNDDVNIIGIAYAHFVIDRGIARAGIMVRANYGKGDYALAGGVHTNSRVGQVIIGQSEIALQLDLGLNTGGQDMWLDHKPLDTSFIDTMNGQGRIERGPQLAIGKHDLLNTGIVAIQARFHFVKGTAGREEVTPAASTSRCNYRAIVEALTKRERTRLLISLGRRGVWVDFENCIGQGQRGSSAFQRGRIRESPDNQVAGDAGAIGLGSRV